MGPNETDRPQAAPEAQRVGVGCAVSDLVAVATRIRCVRCSSLLGPDAPGAPDAAHRQALADAHRSHPGMGLHVAR